MVLKMDDILFYYQARLLQYYNNLNPEFAVASALGRKQDAMIMRYLRHDKLCKEYKYMELFKKIRNQNARRNSSTV